VKAFSSLSTIDCIDNSDISRVVFRARRDVVVKREARADALRCQHFFKWEAVFFFVLVYSKGSAFRFPSARNGLSHLTTSEGNMAKKAKKAKKAKSAVKKTAKKTRKVAKKKK
jgi:hypothetical protein